MLPFDELCEAWARADDADEAGELADEVARRALDVRDPRHVTLLCAAICARLSGNNDDDDEVSAVLDAMTCGPLDTPGARGDAFRRAAAVDAEGIAVTRPALRAAYCAFLLACARRDAEPAGPAVRAAAGAVTMRDAARFLYAPDADGACRNLRALVAAFGPAASSHECAVAARLGALLGGAFFDRDWETRAAWRRADGSCGGRSCFGGENDDGGGPPPAKRVGRSCFGGGDDGDSVPPPAKRARRGPGHGPSLEDVQSLCTGRVAGASSLERARGRGNAFAEDFALELLADDGPPKAGVDFYRVGASTVVLNADARWNVCAQCRDAVQKHLKVACSVNLYSTPPGATTLDPHADDHCVFVAQLSGAKRWRIFEGGKPFPDLGTVMPRPRGDAPFFDVTLHAGDVLYVPRGAPHVCRALDGEPSVHVSIGLDLDPALTWRGALETFLPRYGTDLKGAARAVPDLRRAVLPALRRDAAAFPAGMNAARAGAAGALEAQGRTDALGCSLHDGQLQRRRDMLFEAVHGRDDAYPAVLDSLLAVAAPALAQSIAVTTLVRTHADTCMS